MNKKAFIIVNDIHLKSGNEKIILAEFMNLFDYAEENKITTAVLAGDIFDSRSFQRLNTLLTFTEILDEALRRGIKIIGIPGNHDKPKYEDSSSFLDPFKSHSAFTRILDTTNMVIEGLSVCLMPFFLESMLVERLDAEKGTDILISHFEMNGSTSHGRVSSDRKITPKMLSKWDRVFLGHFHDRDRPAENVWQLQSFIQHNFGENTFKGFTVVSEEDVEYIPSISRKFITVPINIDEYDSKRLNHLIKTHSESDDSVRFQFTGSEEKLKAIDTSKIKQAGIQVDLHFSFDADELMDQPESSVEIKHTKESIESLLLSFCELNKLDHKRGRELFLQHLNS